MVTDWDSPRSRGVVAAEKIAPNFNLWNPAAELTWTGSNLTKVTLTNADGTVIEIDLTYDGSDQLTDITRWAVP